ncbi:MAG: flagellar basal body-associated FliL family protein, partial [Proteobacteria bacterium]|nr:flagellar basal body-associated FliL family protein [Pseudomonadota bacterium]
MNFIWTIVVLVFVVGFGAMTPDLNGDQLVYLLNGPAFVMVVIPSFLIALFSTSTKAWKISLRLSFRSELETTQKEVMAALHFLQICRKVALGLSGASIMLAALLVLLDLTNPEVIGSNAALAITALLYGICITLLCLAAESRIEHRYAAPVSQPLEAVSAPRATAGEPRRSRRGLAIGTVSVAVVLLLLMGGGAASYFLLLAPAEEVQSAEDNRSEMEQFLSEAEPLYTPTFSFTVRLSDGKNAANVSLLAMMKDPMALEYLSGRTPSINDAILRRFSEFEAETLLGKGGKDTAERELLKKINSFFIPEF